MELIKFEEKYSVKVKEIDEQHENIFAVLNKLFEATKVGTASEVLGGIIKDMAEYAVYHFETEEKYMKEFAFEGYDEHKKKHDEFVAKVTDFKNMFDAGQASVSVEVLSFLFDWVKEHVIDMDKQYVQCFTDNGLV